MAMQSYTLIVGLSLFVLASKDLYAQSSSALELMPCAADLAGSESTFGSTIGVLGDIIAVGGAVISDPAEPQDSGVVFVYEGGATNCCALVAPDGDVLFGSFFVRLAGDRLFVSSLHEVFVYRRQSLGAWELETALPIASIPRDVSIDGGIVAVSSAAGIQFFARGDSLVDLWPPIDSISPPVGVEAFVSVSLDGDDLLATATYTGSAENSILVYSRSESDWHLEECLEPPSHSVFGSFGGEIELQRSSAYVADSGNTGSMGVENTGVVFVYRQSDTLQWDLSGELLPRPGQRLEAFGASFLLDEGELFVGASSYDYRQSKFTGIVYRFKRELEAEWRLVERIDPPDPVFATEFGRSLGYDDGLLVVGAPLSAPAGAVYCFDLAPIANADQE